MSIVQQLKRAAQRLSATCDTVIPALEASGHVAHATNPLDYAWAHHQQYIEQWGGLGATTLLLGMNPGPWGMAQSGVPFGATEVTKDFLKITPCDLETPVNAHPKRPIAGLELQRQEVSGTRLWTLIAEVYGEAEQAFKHIFVLNHCPLLLLGKRGENITPDKLPHAVIGEVLEACDEHLREVVEAMGITRIIGVGAYAEQRAKKAFDFGKANQGKTPSGRELQITTCWHPSPASPLANRNEGADWRAQVRSVLMD